MRNLADDQLLDGLKVNNAFRIEFFDDLATVTEGSSVDGASTWEPAGISQKNFHVEGIQLYFDEITTKPGPDRSRSSSEESTSQVQGYS